MISKILYLIKLNLIRIIIQEFYNRTFFKFHDFLEFFQKMFENSRPFVAQFHVLSKKQLLYFGFFTFQFAMTWFN